MEILWKRAISVESRAICPILCWHCVFAKFTHREIRWNIDILCCVSRLPCQISFLSLMLLYFFTVVLFGWALSTTFSNVLAAFNWDRHQFAWVFWRMVLFGCCFGNCCGSYFLVLSVEYLAMVKCDIPKLRILRFRERVGKVKTTKGRWCSGLLFTDFC